MYEIVLVQVQSLSLGLISYLSWQPTPVFLPGESQGLGSLVGCRLWGRTESDTTEATAAAAAAAEGFWSPSTFRQSMRKVKELVIDEMFIQCCLMGA